MKLPLILLFLAAGLGALAAQTPAASPAPPNCSISRHAWTAKGELVLGARLSAGGKSLELGRISGSGQIDENGRANERLEGFSMADSELVDLYTGQLISPLPRLPKKPFLGTMEGIITLHPGDSLIFGVAFPHPPDPPKDKDGKQLDYQFELRVPNIPPIKFSIPFKPED